MQRRVALAVALSIVLVGVAFWSRHSNEEKVAGLMRVEQLSDKLTQDYYDNTNIDALIGTSTPRETEQLSETDLISRQLVLDYVSLAASGQVSEESLAALANKYVENIPTLNSASRVNIDEIKTVSNIRSNFQKYADTLTTIYSKHAKRVREAESGAGDLSTLDSDLYLTVSGLSEAYSQVALELENVSVPEDLLLSHIKLINNYLSSSASTRAISETERDSANAFAGLITLNNNLEEEAVILAEIAQILTDNDI